MNDVVVAYFAAVHSKRSRGHSHAAAVYAVLGRDSAGDAYAVAADFTAEHFENGFAACARTACHAFSA